MLHPSITSADAARVATTVGAITAAVDLRRFDLVAGLFADSVVLDYTALWGGAPATLTPADIVKAWAGLVPGFDATRHDVTDIAVAIDGDSASATAEVDGIHILGDAAWRVLGTYRWRLTRTADGWRVTHMTLADTREQGSRDLVAAAIARVAA